MFDLLEEDSADFVCVDAVSTAVSSCQLTAVKIILSSSVRGGGLRLCRRGFNRRLIFVCVDAVSTALSSSFV